MWGLSGGGVAKSVRSQVCHDPLEESGVGPHEGNVGGGLDEDAASVLPEVVEGTRHDLVNRGWLHVDREGSGL